MEQVATIDELRSKHAALESLLTVEGERPMPDQGVVKQIKRKKLLIKDIIAELERD
ncbi:MAG: YdcH family protein [Alphaproteobacteria bacterium]|nr:YdcH family protein [Alphaproteobacteria bacterium]MCZ6765090.1 YdcH family protein [Alphaproteobacteria bacterium]